MKENKKSCDNVKYPLIVGIQQAQSSPVRWHDFRKRMASYLVKQPNLSQLSGKEIDELNSEYSLCPCGRGLVIVEVVPPFQFWEDPERIPHLLCPNCQRDFKSVEIKKLQPKLAIDADLAVTFDNKYQLKVHSRALWKMLSW